MTRRANDGGRTVRTFALALLCGAGLAADSPLSAGEYNPVLDIGAQAPAWSDLPGTDGRRHALADLKDKEVVVVVFTCNSCPVAADYEDRLVDFAKSHAGPGSKTAVVAINVNLIDEDRLPAMQERAKAKGYPFPYLFDETQKIAKDYGAGYTPEFFVLDKQRRVAYMGALDDSTDPAKAKTRHVEQAVAALLAGRAPAVKETVPIGCRIRFMRKRGGAD